jgi:hypothetical protein
MGHTRVYALKFSLGFYLDDHGIMERWYLCTRVEHLSTQDGR